MDNKLNEYLATEVMGWHIQPYECYEVGKECFAKHDFLFGEHGNMIMPLNDWHPDTDLNQAMMCLDRWMIDTHGGFEMTSNAKNRNQIVLQNKKFDDISPHEYHISVSGNNSTLPLAICEAIKEATNG